MSVVVFVSVPASAFCFFFRVLVFNVMSPRAAVVCFFSLISFHLCFLLFHFSFCICHLFCPFFFPFFFLFSSAVPKAGARVACFLFSLSFLARACRCVLVCLMLPCRFVGVLVCQCVTCSVLDVGVPVRVEFYIPDDYFLFVFPPRHSFFAALRGVAIAGRVRGVPPREGAERCPVGADDGQHHRLPHGVPGALRPSRGEPAVKVKIKQDTAVT